MVPQYVLVFQYFLNALICQQMYIRAQILITSYMFQFIPLFFKRYHRWYLMFEFISYGVPQFYLCITYSTLYGTLIYF
jgi:hypothetical protein